MKISVAGLSGRGNQWRRAVVGLICAMSGLLCLFENWDLNVSFYPLLFQLQYHSLAKMTVAWKTIKLKLVPAFWTLI